MLEEEKKKSNARDFIVTLGTVFLFGAVMVAGMNTMHIIWPTEKYVHVEHVIMTVDGDVISRSSTTTIDGDD